MSTLFAAGQWTPIDYARDGYGWHYKPLPDESCLIVTPGRFHLTWRWQHRGGPDDARAWHAEGYADTAEGARQRADEYLHTSGISTQDGAR